MPALSLLFSLSVAGVQALLEVVNDLFEEQTDLEKIVRKIMHRAQTLLKCERCSVQLLEDIESPVRVSFSAPPGVSSYLHIYAVVKSTANKCNVKVLVCSVSMLCDLYC